MSKDRQLVVGRPHHLHTAQISAVIVHGALWHRIVWICQCLKQKQYNLSI
jgi:G:T-mismatch repair DNA endonuclease (very short patch repair protein)